MENLKNALSRYKGRIIGQNGKTREIIMDMADVQMAIYGKTVSLIGEMDNIMIAKEAIEMILKKDQDTNQSILFRA